MSNVIKINRPAPRRRIASKGDYGAVPHDRSLPYARALLVAVKNDLSAADWFTREDLLHLEVFDHLSTISRYGYLCSAVRRLLEDGDLVELSRTELALPAKAKLYGGGGLTPIHHEYMHTVARLITGIGYDQLFTVMDAVRRWKNDQHLTTNVKRVIVRRAVAAMVKAGALNAKDEQTYWMEKK